MFKFAKYKYNEIRLCTFMFSNLVNNCILSLLTGIQLKPDNSGTQVNTVHANSCADSENWRVLISARFAAMVTVKVEKTPMKEQVSRNFGDTEWSSGLQSFFIKIK